MESLLKNRLKDLANQSYQNNHYTFTKFLSLAEISEFYEIERELNYVKASLYGGNDEAERKVLRFGSPDQLGYEEPFPIVCLEIKPLNDKFADDLNHRDFLGALMNLGIEREMLGDIYVEGKRGILFCLDSIAPFIKESLSRVKHTTVMVKDLDGEFKIPETLKKYITVQVSSERVDAVIARTYNLSRDDSVELFREQKVYINGRLTTGNDVKVKEGDRISVRGFGKFEVMTQGGMSKKQKINLTVCVYK